MVSKEPETSKERNQMPKLGEEAKRHTIERTEKELGPRGKLAYGDYSKRSAIRSWIMAKAGLTYEQIRQMPLNALIAAYNDIKDDAIRGIKDAAPAPGKVEEAGSGEGEPTEPKPVEEGKPAKPEPKDAESKLEAIERILKPALDVEAVRKIAKEEADKVKMPERVIIIEKKEDGKEERKDMGLQHRVFPLLMKILDAGLNVALVGPAGTGKTTAAHNVAKALKIAYECQSFSGTTTKSDLLGFIDANGNYRDTPFRRAFEKGGVWVGDEFDAGNANANVVINAATANGVCSFPDGMREKHKDFRAVVCMNTYGQGANRQYVGRNQLDAATLDRFAFLEWDLDESLEGAFLGVSIPRKSLDIEKGGKLTPEKWLARIKAVRSAIEKTSVRHLVTPRAAMFGATLFAAGVGRDHVEEIVLWKGLDKEQRARVEAGK